MCRSYKRNVGKKAVPNYEQGWKKMSQDNCQVRFIGETDYHTLISPPILLRRFSQHRHTCLARSQTTRINLTFSARATLRSARKSRGWSYDCECTKRRRATENVWVPLASLPGFASLFVFFSSEERMADVNFHVDSMTLSFSRWTWKLNR